MFMYVFELVFLFPSGKYPEVELLSHMVVLFLIFLHNLCIIFDSSVQSLSCVRLFATPWTAAHQASLSVTPGAYLNSCPSSQWCHPTNSSSVVPFSSRISIFPSIRAFFSESVLHIRWPKCWSFSISPSSEHPGLISFRMDWVDLLAVQGTQESSPTPQFKSINSLVLSFIYSPTLTSIHDYWKNQSFD